MTLEEMDIVDQMARKYPTHFQLARDVQGLMHAFKGGAVASLMGMEGVISSLLFFLFHILIFTDVPLFPFL